MIYLCIILAFLILLIENYCIMQHDHCIPVRSTYGGYYGLVVITPRPQTLHRSHDNLKNPYRIASIFYI